MVTRAQIKALADQIVAEFQPQRVILFGSYANGTFGEESDVDLLVVLPVNGPRFRLAARIRTMLPSSIPIDILVRSPEDVAAGRAGGDPMLNEATGSGVVLYSAAA
jgi:predicted nucleotidyltransferase